MVKKETILENRVKHPEKRFIDTTDERGDDGRDGYRRGTRESGLCPIKPNKKKPPEIALKYLRFHEKPPETLRK
jgi:hypothetical protein